MIVCPNCGTQLADESSFCTNCGVPLVVSFKCSNCGGEVNEHDTVCLHCGAVFLPEGSAEPAKENPNTAENGKADKGGRNNKIPLIIMAAVLVLAIIGVGVFLALKLLGKSKGTELAIYIKDKELVYSDLKDEHGTKVSKSLFDESTDAKSISGKNSAISASIKVSKDGKILFYPDKSKEIYAIDDYYPLYYCYTEDPEGTAEKIDGNVCRYLVSDDGKIVTYVKNDGTLKQYDMKSGNSDTISSKVYGYRTSEDGKEIVFLYNNQKSGALDLCYIKSGEDKVTLDSDITSLRTVSEDFKNVYYIKENTLYIYQIGEDKEEIADDVVALLAVYDSGELYYVSGSEGVFDICYYKDKKSESIGKYYTDRYYDGIMTYTFGNANPVVVFFENSENNKESREYFIACGKNRSSLGDTVSRADINMDGSYIYYLVQGDNEDNTGELFRVKIEDSKPTVPEAYEKKVYNGYICPFDGENILYYKDVENLVGKLYLNKKKVQTGVSLPYTDYDIDSGKLYYLTEYDKDKEYGTLEIFDGDKEKEISGDVNASFVITPEGNILYLKDYSTESCSGDLYYYDGDDDKKIDDDVNIITNPWN